MRLLYSSHTYLVNENQKKLAAIAALPDVAALKVITPHQWKEPVLGVVPPHIDPQANFTLKPIPVWLAGNEMRFLYQSWDLGLAEFRPDVVVVENGAGAFAYTQFLRAQQRYAPRAKSVFFTWWNLPYRTRWPLSEVEAWNLRHSHGAIAGNQAAADILRDHGYTGPLLVLPQLGVDEVVFAPGESAALKQSLGLQHTVIGYAGRLVPEKGLRVLLAALDDFPHPFDLVLLGRGPLADEIRAWGAARPPHHRLHLLDSVPHTQVAGYLRALDIFVLPSLSTSFWLEQFGHVLIEAMACEVCTVGSSSAEIPNVIGEAGVVIPEGDVAAWRATLSALVSDPARRMALGKAGRQRVSAHYTHPQIARQTVDFFKSL